MEMDVKTAAWAAWGPPGGIFLLFASFS